MNKLMLIVIILLIFIIVLILNRHNVELFAAEENLQKQKKKGSTNFLGNNRTQQIDELYETATTYDNKEGREGLDICVEKCPGNCVEFGVHGRAFCFK